MEGALGDNGPVVNGHCSLGGDDDGGGGDQMMNGLGDADLMSW